MLTFTEPTILAMHQLIVKKVNCKCMPVSVLTPWIVHTAVLRERSHGAALEPRRWVSRRDCAGPALRSWTLPAGWRPTWNRSWHRRDYVRPIRHRRESERAHNRRESERARNRRESERARNRRESERARNRRESERARNRRESQREHVISPLPYGTPARRPGQAPALSG
jgi:hypothetical protein